MKGLNVFFKKIEKRQSNSMFAEQEWFWPPGGAWQCLKTFGVVTTWEGRCYSQVVPSLARDAVKQATIHRKALHDKELSS